MHRVEALSDLDYVKGIFRGESENRDAIERTACGDHAAGTQEPPRRLEPDQIVEGGGYTARASRVGTEREAGQSGRDCHRGTRTGTAGDVVGMKGASGCA